MRIRVGLGVLMFAGGAMALMAQQPSQSTGTSSSDGHQMSTTPRAGSSTSSVDTSRSSQPGMETHNMHAPAMASDCTNDGWRGYTSPKFKSEKACQSYVKKHMKKGMTGDTHGTTGETNAPHPDMSSGTGANTGTHAGSTSTSGSTSSSGAQPKPTPRP